MKRRGGNQRHSGNESVFEEPETVKSVNSTKRAHRPVGRCRTAVVR